MKKVLIIDDEPDIVSYLEMILQDNGFETATAENGKEALEKVRKEPPDLVSSIPVLIVTGVTGLGGDENAYEKFISNRRLVPAPEGFFHKPIDRDAFVAAVKELLSA
jgi:hypothetical protein